MKILAAAVSIFLAGIVTLAEKHELCKTIDPHVCLIIQAVKIGLLT